MLTAKGIEALDPHARQYKKHDAAGLYLLIKPSGARLWRLNFKHDGKAQTLALGVYGAGPKEVSLKAAREKRDEALALIAKGIHPGRHKRQQQDVRIEAAQHTFAKLADAFYESKRRAWSVNHDRDVRRMLAEMKARLGKQAMSDITLTDVDRRLLAPIIQRGALTYARDVLAYFRQVMRFHNKQRVGRHLEPLRDPSEFAEVPAGPKVRHHTTLPVGEVGPFLNAVAHADASAATRIAVRLLLLTGVRTTELRAAHWKEIDVQEKIWRIPGERMKAGAAHLVPLSPQALALLAQLRTLTGKYAHMFPNANDGKRPITENTILFAIYRCGYKGRLTSHGMRSMLSSWANEHGYSADAVERQLAHAPRDKVRSAYMRADFLDERRRMMDAWAQFLDDSEREARTKVAKLPGKRAA